MAFKTVLRTGYSKVLLVVGLVITIYAAIWLVPFQPWMPSEGLDSSWADVIEYSLLNQFVFGEDIIFTYGPLGFLSTNKFQQNLYPLLLMYWLLVTVAIILLFYHYYRVGNSLVTIIAYLLVVIGISPFPDTKFFILPLMLVLLQTSAKSYKLEVKLASGLLIVLCGLACLVKGTVLFLIFPIFLLLDIKTLITKKVLPKLTLSLVSTILVAFFLAGQPLSKIGTFFWSVIEISKGYSLAMQATGPFNQIFIFLGLAALLVVLMIFQLLHRKFNWDDSIIFFSLIIFLFLAFKHGFVRHDVHATVAGTAILVATNLLAIYFYAKNTLRILKIVTLITIPLSLIFFLYILDFHTSVNPQRLLKSKFVRQPTIALQRTRELFLGNGVADLQKIRSKSLENIANKHSLPNLEGSVDIFPWDQATLLANNLEYNPRPIFQSYSAYTPKLIEKNIKHLNSPNAADYLLFDIKTINNRYPTLDDGALWPIIWQNYDPVGNTFDFLVLKRRSLPREVSFNTLSKPTSALGQFITLPQTSKPIWAEMRVNVSILGKLLTLAFKQANLNIEVIFDNGHSEIKRLIPSMASEGFLLSPYTTEEKDFVDLFLSSDSERLFTRSVNKVRILESKMDRLFFKREVYWEFSEIDISQNFTEPMTEEFRQQLEWLLIRKDMLASNESSNPYIYISKEGFFAHAPAKLKLSFRDSEELYIKFGIREGAWQEGNTDGVLFSLFLLNSAGEKVNIWSRLLQPKQVEADRGEQVVSIDLPDQEGILLLETEPYENADWDWSYWSMVQFK